MPGSRGAPRDARVSNVAFWGFVAVAMAWHLLSTCCVPYPSLLSFHLIIIATS